MTQRSSCNSDHHPKQCQPSTILPFGSSLPTQNCQHHKAQHQRIRARFKRVPPARLASHNRKRKKPYRHTATMTHKQIKC